MWWWFPFQMHLNWALLGLVPFRVCLSWSSIAQWGVLVFLLAYLQLRFLGRQKQIFMGVLISITCHPVLVICHPILVMCCRILVILIL